jgi:predicted CoA-binding protein
MPITDDDGVRRLLGSDSVAVIGCSTTPGKAAHDVPRYLLDHGYDVLPVNPFADEIFGREAYDSIGDVEAAVELVDVFRPSDEVAGIVDEVLDRHEARGDVRAIWLQLGIRDDEAAARAEAAGIDVVQDACMKVEHGRLVD